MASLRFFWANFHFLRQKSWENSWNYLVESVNSTKFPIFWLNFTKFLTPKKWKNIVEGFHLHKKWLFQMNIYWLCSIIWYLWTFIRAFCILTWTHGFSNVSKYWQWNSLGTWNDKIYITNLTCDKLKMKIVWSSFIHRFAHFTHEFHVLKTCLTHE